MTHYTEEELTELWQDGLLTDQEFDEALNALRNPPQPTAERLTFISAGRTRPR